MPVVIHESSIIEMKVPAHLYLPRRGVGICISNSDDYKIINGKNV